MAKLKKKALRFLVATDIAARGIDVSNLEYVFIYDMHKDTDQYIHRAGRTARAGNRGVAISMVSQMEAIDLKKFAAKSGLVLEERKVPSEDHVQARLCEKLSARLESELRDFTSAQRERSKRYKGVLNEISAGENAEEILLMLIDNYHQGLIRKGRETIEEVKPEAKISQEKRHNDDSRRPRRRRPPKRN
jgi:ATP-dependent RNA helicase DeaD